MRDFIVTAMVFGLLPFILRNPVMGIYAWVWLSMMNPHRATFGFARSMPFAYIVAIATVIGVLAHNRDRRPVPMTAPTIALLFLLFWMTFTSFFSIADSSLVLERWIFVFKSQVMIFLTLILIRGRQQVDRLIWVIVVSIGFYGVKGGIYTVATGGSGRVWGPPGLLEGNNELAVALVMMVPLMVYLLQVSTHKLIRIGLMVSIATTALAILGSQSRGALLAIVVMGFFLALKGKRPVLMSLVISTLLVAVIAFMPDAWTQRMDTIQSYEGDGSAMSRIYTWRTLFNCALDRPFVGAGFVSDNIEVFRRYAPRDAQFAHFDGLVLVAHSIYFQMIGEHGFVGLMLFLTVGVITWVKASQLSKATRDCPDFGAWVPLLMPMLQVGIIGYAVGGAFLSLAYLDLVYYLPAIVILVDATWRDHRANALAARTASGQYSTS